MTIFVSYQLAQRYSTQAKFGCTAQEIKASTCNHRACYSHRQLIYFSTCSIWEIELNPEAATATHLGAKSIT